MQKQTNLPEQQEYIKKVLRSVTKDVLTEQTDPSFINVVVSKLKESINRQRRELKHKQ